MPECLLVCEGCGQKVFIGFEERKFEVVGLDTTGEVVIRDRVWIMYPDHFAQLSTMKNLMMRSTEPARTQSSLLKSRIGST